MRYVRLLIIAAAAICVLGLGVFAFVRAPKPQGGGDVIIIKGGSLTIQCPDNSNCMPYNSNTKKYENKNKLGKIDQIVVMDSSGTPLPGGTFTRANNFPDGKPQIAITYK